MKLSVVEVNIGWARQGGVSGSRIIHYLFFHFFQMYSGDLKGPTCPFKFYPFCSSNVEHSLSTLSSIP